MKIETLKQKSFKKLATRIFLGASIFSMIAFIGSYTIYQNTKNNPIKRINNQDSNMMAVYLDDGNNNYNKASDGKIPSSGYTLNMDADKTRCVVSGEVDSNVTIAYENGEVKVSKVTKPGTKCYFYFDKIKDTEAPVIGVHEARNVEKNSMDLYVKASDNIGIAGYFFKISTDSDWKEAKCIGQTSCIHSVTALTQDTSYTYDVKVCDAAGNCPTTTITQKTKADGIEASEIIAGGTTTTDSMFAGITGNGIYIWTKGDYSGGNQPIKYFRGNVNNNWVVFGKDGSNYIWWRIIRNNSNGSLRMIYAGVSSSKTSAPATTGAGTQIGTKSFNTGYNDNMYVGFKYTNGEAHGNGTNSTILGETNSTDKITLYGWYNATLGTSTDYSSKIDLDAGFCNDRTPKSGTGIGTTETTYAASDRLYTNKVPSLLCTNADDIFKIPVGLITVDEVNMGGMVYSSSANTSSYLYTNSYYWTMSPNSSGVGFAYVFWVHSYGFPGDPGVNATFGVRPVVNLKSDTLFEEGGNGTSTNPYVVIGM